MLRAGVDLVQVKRIEGVLVQYGNRFLDRVFTPAEQAYAGHRCERLATRFAAKEAASKALGVGIQHRDGVGWLEIEVVTAENGDPSLRLTGKAAARALELGLTEFALSLSHSETEAIAFVVAQ